ncbi:DUF6907 domain-containing protein [Streptomyces sp. NPDC002889]|uniref:DUF6907 domain-containing protein n=1 Tax=Streptomyces sp. NPDC002889 TaxID=3364669 RepID=UPI0036892464
MSKTVPSYVKPSGGVMVPYPSAGMLPGIPKQTAPVTPPRISTPDTAPTGRLPHTADLAAIGESIADRIRAEVLSLADKISRAELADLMTSVMVEAGLSTPDTTAQQRGVEWRARYGCPAWCVMDHAGDDGEPGWHQGPTAEAIAPIPFTDSLPGEGPAPVLAARVTQTSEDAQIFGITTRLWVDVDTEVLELDVAETDVLIARLERFLPQLRILRAQLAAASVADFPSDEKAKAEWLATPAQPRDDR